MCLILYLPRRAFIMFLYLNFLLLIHFQFIHRVRFFFFFQFSFVFENIQIQFIFSLINFSPNFNPSNYYCMSKGRYMKISTDITIKTQNLLYTDSFLFFLKSFFVFLVLRLVLMNYNNLPMKFLMWEYGIPKCSIHLYCMIGLII